MSYMIQDGVLKLSIGSADLFPDIANMTAITIPEGVTELGNQVFANCRKLTRVTLGKNVTSVGANAFKNCKRLKTLTLQGKKKTTLDKNALKGARCKIVAKKKVVRK